MFRQMRRNKQQLSNDECIEILINEPRGVMAVHGEDGFPYAFPMNHIYLNEKLYFHSAKQGHKIDALVADNKVSFCVMDKGYKNEGEWALNIKSVVLFGEIKIVEDEKTAVEIVRKLGIKHYPESCEVEKLISQSKGHFEIWELKINHLTGKLVNES